MKQKFFLAAMSLAALTACTNDEIESIEVAKVKTSSVQFEVINDAETRASMDGNKIAWSTDDGDIFTLYHGATLGDTKGYQNATYTATAVEGSPATLTTPSMILDGGAVMVWPADTTFRITSAKDLTITIPAVQTNIENNLPYMSDQVQISAYNGTTAAVNTAGYDRKYPVYMRPMASQLIIKADYAGTDATLAALYGPDEEDGINEIEVSSIDLKATTEKFTTEIPVKFEDPSAAQTAQWNAAVSDNAWKKVTKFDLSGTLTSVAQLTAKEGCLDGINGCKFLILPQTNIASADVSSAVVVNTIYGKVVVGESSVGGAYSTVEAADAWYRYIKSTSSAESYEIKATTAETEGENVGKHKTTTEVKNGMMQTLNGLSTYTAPESLPIVKDEPIGAYTTRYVKVLLSHLDMTDLHVKNDKHLRDVVRVWEKINHASVTVNLDGDANKEFAISQKTIEVINEINANATGGRSFKVRPCKVANEKCETIVITGSAYKQDVQDLNFIWRNGSSYYAKVALADEGDTNPWLWKGDVKVSENSGGNMILSITNRGTMVNAETATLRTIKSAATQVNVPFINDGTWNISGGDLNVQFDVTNNGTVNIANGADYCQDACNSTATTFTNEASTLPQRFLPEGKTEQIGVVNNEGVFACIKDKGIINNYGLIEHAHVDAKTYITANMTTGADFQNAFSASNKMGTINLPYSNKDENNISISAALNQGFVSVTVDNEPSVSVLATSVVGSKVNYVNVKGGVTKISELPTANIKYVEINNPGTEMIWSVTSASYDGLMILSNVNITEGQTLTVNKATWIKDDVKVYNAGTFIYTKLNGYFGDKTANKDNIKTWM